MTLAFKKARGMFFREINEELKISLTIPQYADELFTLTDGNRSYLKQWLPWLDAIQDVSDTKKFIELQLLKFHQGGALHETIFYKNEVASVLGFNQIDSINGIGYLGYWLGETFTGKGIMTFAVKDLLRLGFDYLPIQKVDVRCAVENSKSRAIPERLEFRNEGIIRQAELVNSTYLDHVVYGLLKQEFKC